MERNEIVILVYSVLFEETEVTGRIKEFPEVSGSIAPMCRLHM